MRELLALLSPGGRLLLGVPVAHEDDIYFPNHRIYGPQRLPRLLEGWALRGRVWNGRAVKGGLEHAADKPPLYRRRWCWRGAASRRRYGPGTKPGTKHNFQKCDLESDGPDSLSDYQHQPVLVLERAPAGSALRALRHRRALEDDAKVGGGV